MAAPPERTGGQVLVDQLLALGSSIGYCVPGESYLDVLDALFDHRDRFRLINARHEGAAANMAAAYGQLTDRPGICLVSRGPGAAHAAVGVHTAAQDSSPMLLLVGDLPRGHLGRDGFQDLDCTQVFASVAKSVARVDDASRIPEILTRSFHVATSGRPGPVVIALPQDVLEQRVDVGDLAVAARSEPAIAGTDLAELIRRLSEAERPMVVAGGPGWDRTARAALAKWVSAWQLPLVTSFRQQDLLDNRSSSYVGMLGTSTPRDLIDRVGRADVVLTIGTRLDQKTSIDYALFGPRGFGPELIQVYPAADDIGRIADPAVAIVASARSTIKALAESGAPTAPRWASWTADARESYLADRRPQPQPGPVNLGEAMLTLRELLPDDAVITNGAGNFAGWIHRHFEFRDGRTQLAPQSGAMGYGLPAAIAAASTGRLAVCIAGDGDFLMYPQELATIAEYELPVLIIVIDNGSYGTIQMHQEKRFPGRAMAVNCHGPDFTAFAKSFGIHAEAVRQTAEFRSAVSRALDHAGPALLAVTTSPDAMSTRMSLTELRRRSAELPPEQRRALTTR
jgi:acetolactate synthase-1/2/3 large subunit